MERAVTLILLGLSLTTAAAVHAQPTVYAQPVVQERPSTYAPRIHRLRFDIPAVDVRENLELGFWPSMQQSLAIAKDSYYLVHAGILSIPYPRAVPKALVYFSDGLLIFGADVLIMFLPAAEGWMHEEWHRSVMSQYGISSYNGIYDLKLFDDLINVSRVKDEDLIRLKRDHPADQVRMSAAGIEGDYSLGVAFDKDRFFFGTRPATTFSEWLTVLNAILYMNDAAFDSNGTTEKENEKEGGGTTDLPHGRSLVAARRVTHVKASRASSGVRRHRHL